MSLYVSLRRQAYRIVHPRNHRDLLAILNQRVESPEDYSLQPFLETRSLFIHVPKCAGTSLNRAMYGCRAGGHLNMRQYQMIMPTSFWADAFCYTFVRNPFDRLHSAYRFLRQGGMTEADQSFAREHECLQLPFHEFVKAADATPTLWQYWHFMPQVSFLKSIRGKIELDFIGRLERIDADLEVVRQHVTNKEPLEHLNASAGGNQSRGYHAAYDGESRAIAERRYAEDLSLLNYEYGE